MPWFGDRSGRAVEGFEHIVSFLVGLGFDVEGFERTVDTNLGPPWALSGWQDGAC